MQEVDIFDYMDYYLERANTRYYQTTIKGNIVTGTAGELIELIDEYLLDSA